MRFLEARHADEGEKGVAFGDHRVKKQCGSVHCEDTLKWKSESALCA